MSIRPDTKDWTWVLERRCTECGFDASTLDHRAVAAYLRENAAEWPEVLQRADARERPAPQVWSPLEYAAHVRDVFRLFRTRVELMLTEDDPAFENWDQDKTAIEERYGEQDPATVAAELIAAAAELADLLDAVETGEAAPPAPSTSIGVERAVPLWERTGRRGDGASFTVATLARYLAHDPAHHLVDVRR